MTPLATMTTRLLVVVAGLGGSLLFFSPHAFAATVPQVSLVASDAALKPVQHGLDKLKLALQQKGVRLDVAGSLPEASSPTVVVAGLTSGAGEAARLVADLQLLPRLKPESLLIRKLNRNGKAVVLIAGADARGLMYALLEALAQNRFNSLVVIFGYENGGFLAPCYPCFFDVPDFPDVRMVGITPEQQQRNLVALNRPIQMAHDRRLNFTVGIWNHIYRGGVQGGGIPGADEATKKPVPGLVGGVTAENLVPYTKAALAKFVKQVPAVDAIQFRMHDESGLQQNEQEDFWRDVFQRMKQAAPNLRLDLRAKGLPDSVIQSASEVGVPFRITTKY